MANVGKSLDEIIASTKQSKRNGGGGGGARGGARPARTNGSGGGGRNFGGFSKRTSDGRWQRDLYQDLDAPMDAGDDLFDVPLVPIAQPVAAAAGNPNKVVRVNIANLAPSVTTADLEELFEPYAPDSVSVHFSESGQSLGTGDAKMKRKDAEKMLNDYRGIALDGQRLEIVIVDGTRLVGAGGGLADRITLPTPRPQTVIVTGGGPIRRSNGFGAVRKGRVTKNGGGGGAHFLDRLAGDERPGKRGGGGGGGGGERRERKPKVTEADLDAELDAYMKKP